MRIIRINRAKWRAGQDSHDPKRSCGIGNTELSNSQGFKCCLGFAAQQLSHKPLCRINGYGEPEQLSFMVSPLNERDGKYYYNNTELSNKAITINDDESTTLKQKERLLINLFAKYDLDLKFFGEYVHDSREYVYDSVA